MYLLYCDFSGNVGSARERHLVLAGVSVKEDAIYHVISELDRIVERHQLPLETELHANEIVNGRRRWRAVPREVREALVSDCLKVFHGPSRYNLRCFGIIIEKAALQGEDPVVHAFEQVSSRFNLFVQRQNTRSATRSGARHRGLLIFDESRYEQEIQSISADFRVRGTRWGKLPVLAEVPLFTSSKSSRLIQLADLVSYALWRRYERLDNRLFATFVSAFDHDGGVIHGLYHKAMLPGCDCPACLSRLL